MPVKKYDKTFKDLNKVKEKLSELYDILENNEDVNEIVASLKVFQKSIGDSIAIMNSYLDEYETYVIIIDEKSYIYVGTNIIQILNFIIDNKELEIPQKQLTIIKQNNKKGGNKDDPGER